MFLKKFEIAALLNIRVLYREIIVNEYLVFENLCLLPPQFFLLEGKRKMTVEKSIGVHVIAPRPVESLQTDGISGSFKQPATFEDLQQRHSTIIVVQCLMYAVQLSVLPYTSGQQKMKLIDVLHSSGETSTRYHIKS